MIARIQIKLNLSKEETIEFLKNNTVALKHKGPLGIGSIENNAEWKKLSNPDNFRFRLDLGILSPWWGKCSLKEASEKGKTILTILILPPIIFILLFIIMMIAIFYQLISNAFELYGEPNFLLPIIMPIILIGFVVFIWFLIWGYGAKKTKKGIIESFEKQLSKTGKNENLTQ